MPIIAHVLYYVSTDRLTDLILGIQVSAYLLKLFYLVAWTRGEPLYGP